jgi:hypothetical protein
MALDTADGSKGRSGLPRKLGPRAGEGTSSKPASGRQEDNISRPLIGDSEREPGDRKSAKPEAVSHPDVGEASAVGARFPSGRTFDARTLDSGVVVKANTDQDRMVLTAYGHGRETQANQLAKVDCVRRTSGVVEARLAVSSTAAGQHLRSEVIGQVEQAAAVAGATEVRFREQAPTDSKKERLQADWKDRGYDASVVGDDVVAARSLDRVSRPSVADEHLAAASELMSRAKSAEPDLTRRLDGVARASGGQLVDLKTRLKEDQDRIAQKLAIEMTRNGVSLEVAAERQYDINRYTIQLPEDHYTEGARQAIASLIHDGDRVGEVRNTWEPRHEQGYRGINCVLRTKDGTRYELQFHTQESLAAKHDNHPLYKRTRGEALPKSERADLDERMQQRAAIPVTPKGAEEIRKQHFE